MRLEFHIYIVAVEIEPHFAGEHFAGETSERANPSPLHHVINVEPQGALDRRPAAAPSAAKSAHEFAMLRFSEINCLNIFADVDQEVGNRAICFSWGCPRICPCSVPLRAIPCTRSKTTIRGARNIECQGTTCSAIVVKALELLGGSSCGPKDSKMPRRDSEKPVESFWIRGGVVAPERPDTVTSFRELR
jgi:hypothetical protein